MKISQPPHGISLFTNGKDNVKNYSSQIEVIAKAFEVKVATMLMVAHVTGIERASICRYCATLRKENRIALLFKKRCQISNHRAGYYTTDKSKFPSSSQRTLNLF